MQKYTKIITDSRVLRFTFPYLPAQLLNYCLEIATVSIAYDPEIESVQYKNITEGICAMNYYLPICIFKHVPPECCYSGDDNRQ